MRGQDQSSSSLFGYVNFEGRIRAKYSPRLSGDMLAFGPGAILNTNGLCGRVSRRRGATP
jgi:hypothetical protein